MEIKFPIIFRLEIKFLFVSYERNNIIFYKKI